MKRTACFYHVLACMLLICITACDRDNSKIEDEIPTAIKNDFSERNPSAKIKTTQMYSDDLYLIEFTDQEQNEAMTWYADDTWKMTYTEIPDLQQLPTEVQNTFYTLGYGDAQNVEIFKTERDGIAKGLYTLHFQYRWKKVENMEHYIFINNDGFYLTKFTWIPNDTRWFPTLPEVHLDFIAKKYNGAEIRGYINNGGYFEYFILHNNTLKCVSLRGEDETDREFWRETRYELSIDTKIPENVARVLKHNDPDFTYTHLYYIESEEGNAYFFQDKKRDNELGYTISENSQLTEE